MFCGLWRSYLSSAEVKFGFDEGFDSFFASDAETEQAAGVFEVDVEIEEGTAFGFGGDPVGQLVERDITGIELEFVALFSWESIAAQGHQLEREFRMACALGGSKGVDIAEEFALRHLRASLHSVVFKTEVPGSTGGVDSLRSEDEPG